MTSCYKDIFFKYFCFLLPVVVVVVTKAPEKIQNIEAAMGVFEKWLEDNGGGASNKNAKADDDEKVDTVPGLGFKDTAAAKKTLE